MLQMIFLVCFLFCVLLFSLPPLVILKKMKKHELWTRCGRQLDLAIAGFNKLNAHNDGPRWPSVTNRTRAQQAIMAIRTPNSITQ